MNFLKYTSSRIAFAVLFLAAGFVPAASAATSSFQILLDLDNQQNTGCDVATLTGTFKGVEQILTTTVVTGGSSAQVTAATVKSCVSGTTFGAATPVTPPAGHPLPWPVGVSNGTGGTSVIETFYPLSLSPVTKPPIIRLAVLAFDNGAVLRDELLKTQPTPGNGPPILLQGASISEIPTLSEWGLLFLGLVLAVAAVALLRRRTVIAVLLAVLLLGAAGVAWAAVCDLNGTTIGEWSIANLLASEPVSDAPAGTDMRAFYGFKDAALNALCFRIDALLLFNTPPTANPDAATVVEDAAAAPVNVLANDTDPDVGDTLTIQSVTQPANGTVVITGGGSGLTYKPNANYCNTPPGTTLDTFTYTLAPGGPGTTATVSMTVTCVDDNPTAVNDTATVAEDAPATAIPVLANDTDPDGGAISITSVTQPANGTVAITGGGTGLTYTPNANYCNLPPGTTPDTFTYTLTPGGSTATVSVSVTCADDAPTAVADAATVAEDSGANPIPVLANDTDPDGGPKSVASVTQPANGTVVITGGGTGLTYAPNADYCNTPPGTTLDTFTYTLAPGGSSTTVTVTVTCSDDNPVAVPDAATVAEDSGATPVPVLANDTDTDGGPISISSVTQPANGTVVITGGGTGLTYAPNANYCNTPPGTALDTFTYTLTPGSSSTTVTMTVTCVDDNPTAVADTATVGEDSGANPIPVLANDTDPDGGPISISAVTQPANGTVVITGGGTGLTYQPNANYCNSVSGPADTFTYTLTPGGSSTTVSVTVTCADDAPVAVNDTATVGEDSGASAIPVLANDTDLDGGPISISAVTQPANGVVAITGGGSGLTYAPNANYCNLPPGTTPDTFTYTLTPGGSSATVSVSVTCVNDAPVVDLDADNSQGTTGSDFAVTFTEGTPAVLLEDPTDATVTDIDSPTLATLTVTITNLLDTGNETLSTDVTGTSITANYVAATGVLTLTGPDTLANFRTVLRKVRYQNTDVDPDTTPRVIQFVANDGAANSNTATSTVTIVAVDTPPTAVNDSATVAEDSGATPIPVLTNDTDPDNGPISITSVTQPANGTVVITGGGTGVTYAPNANYCNLPPGTTPDTFTYTLTPGGSTATVSVTVTCADDNPVAVPDAATVLEDSGPNPINVLANDTDADGGPISVGSVTQPANGTVVITGGGTGVSYTPNANYCNSVSGPADTFTYTLTPGSSSTTVTVTVTCVDDNPTAVADSATVVEDSGANAINVLANDTDPDVGDTLTIQSVTQPANGTVVITGGGSGLTYKPNANYCNTPPGTTLDTFTYTLAPGGPTTTATVSMTVTCVDDNPTAVNDTATVAEDAPATA
ncbi:MAG: IPTL-CTERM sorting domain-containing protein, partial [Thermoanaerobaculia bacterium]